MKKAFGILVPLILWAPLLFAQGKFTATASKTNVKVGEYFVIDFSLNANSKNFTPPNLSKLRILAGPSTTTSEIVINGDTVFKSIFFSYIVSVTKEGIYSIDTASATINGHITLLSNPLKITVKGQVTPKEQVQQFTQRETNMPHWAFDTLDSKNISKQIFIKAEVDKKHTCVGEPIKVTYSLYFRVGLDGYRLNKIPDFIGFRVQKVSNPDNRKNFGTTENVNGKVYNVAILMQRVVFPQHSGDLTISPFTMNTILHGQPVDPSNLFSYVQQLKYEVKSDPLIIHVEGLSKSHKATGS